MKITLPDAVGEVLYGDVSMDPGVLTVPEYAIIMAVARETFRGQTEGDVFGPTLDEYEPRHRQWLADLKTERVASWPDGDYGPGWVSVGRVNDRPFMVMVIGEAISYALPYEIVPAGLWRDHKRLYR